MTTKDLNELNNESLATFVAEAIANDNEENCGEAVEDAIRADFIAAVRDVVAGETAVADVIRRAIDELDYLEPAELAELLTRWAMQAGACKKYARELVSRHLCKGGKRRRGKGGGRKAKFDEVKLRQLAAFARELFEAESKGALRAAQAFAEDEGGEA